MKKLITIFIVVSLMLALAPVTAFAHTEEVPLITDLIAGGGNPRSATDVGDVLVWNDGDYLYVKYEITDEDWCISETHLEVATSLEDMPQTKKGNPIPGHFAYRGEHECVAGVIYSIPLSWDQDTELFIAAHGVVQSGGVDGLGRALPDQVTIGVTYPGEGFGAPSYFDVTVSGGTMLDGTYDSYCLDADQGYGEGTADVYSSYEPLPPGLIEYPENLDLVNWIINQGFVGQPSGCDGAYTWGDLQWAIWQLLEAEPPADHSSLRDWSLCRAEKILDAAYLNGEGFVPGCGTVVGIVLAPEVSWQQPILIWVEVPCPQDETAWGDGLAFPGKNWATYFAYGVQ